MKQIRVLGACLVAVLAVASLTAAGASAEAPEFGRCLKQTGGKYANSGCTKLATEVKQEKFEWTSTILKNKFHGKMKEATLATLETVGGTKITCKEEGNENTEFSGPKTVSKLVAKFNGCETSSIPCNSAGAAGGEIITNPLSGLLGVEKIGTTPPINNKLEVQLKAEAGGALAKFSCATINVEVIGCVAHPVPTGKMLIKATEKFAASKGEQKPDKFVGGPADECALESNSGSGFEEAGQTITAIIEGEEKIEANPAV